MIDVIIVQSYEKSKLWKSIELILNGFETIFLDLYRTKNFNLYHFDYKKDSDWSFFEKIDPGKNCCIIYLYNNLNLSPVISFLSEKYPCARHLFSVEGNLMVCPLKWINYQKLLREKKVEFIFSSAAYESFSKKIFKNHRTRIIPFYIQESKKEKNIRKRSEKSRDFLFGGRLTESKGVIQLLHVFSQKPFSNYNLYLAGDTGKDNFRLHNNNSQKSLIDKMLLNRPSNIHLLGQLSQDQFIQELRNTKCFLYPSVFHDEDFGVSALQALREGADLIVSNWGGLKSYHSVDGVRVIPVTEMNGKHRCSIQSIMKELLKYLRDDQYEKIVDLSSFSRNVIADSWRDVLMDNDFVETTSWEVTKLYKKYSIEHERLKRIPFSISENFDLYFKLYEGF